MSNARYVIGDPVPSDNLVRRIEFGPASGLCVGTAPMSAGMEETAPSKVPAVHVELEGLFKCLIQMDEVIKQLSQRLNSVSAPAVQPDEPQRAQPANYCSVARQIAGARESVQDATTTLIRMIDALQV